MYLVDKQDYVAVVLDGGNDLFKPLLEVAAVTAAREQPREVEGKHRFAGEKFGHRALDDGLRQPLHDSAFAHAWLSDQHGIVLAPARQDLYDAVDLALPADHGVEFAEPRAFGHVNAEFRNFLQPRASPIFPYLFGRFVRVHADFFLELFYHSSGIGAQSAQNTHSQRIAHAENRKQNMLRADKRGALVYGKLHGAGKHIFCAGRQPHHIHRFVDRLFEIIAVALGVDFRVR